MSANLVQTGYPSLLVHVDVSDGAAERVRLAARLAKTWGSMLIGTAATTQYLSLYGDRTLLSPGMVEDEQKRTDDFFADARKLFFSCTDEVKDTAWHAELGDETSVVIAQARRADLLILGHNELSEMSLGVSTLSIGDVLVNSGRPVLIVPANVDVLLPRTIVIGWKDTKEVRRAISDALPMLRMASSITVVAVSPKLEPRPWEDIQRYLERHGLKAAFEHREDRESLAGSILIQTAREKGADLIVSGAYGRRRLTEWLLGGVTLDLIAQSPICCLMSH